MPVIDMVIVGQVATIVVVGKPVPARGAVERKSGNIEDKTENNGSSSQRRKPVGFRPRGWNMYLAMNGRIHAPRSSRGFHNSLLLLIFAGREVYIRAGR